MKNFFRPTLVRRVVSALLIAFLLVWIALLSYEYWGFKQAMRNNSGLRQVSESLIAALSTVSDNEHARVVMNTTSVWLNKTRHNATALSGELLFQLRTLDGNPLYASPGLGSETLIGVAQLTEQKVGAQVFWLYCVDGTRWSLYIAEPKINDAALLAMLGKNLLPYMVISFPFVLLPIWLAVYQGLRPLRRLRDMIVARPADDLSDIGFDARYTELQPLVLAFDDLLHKLRGKVSRERAFVQDAAHELRTPMAVIATQAHVMARTDSTSARLQAQNDLDHAIARASHLTQQLLELAALDEAPQAPPDTIDVADLLRQQLAQRVPLAQARGIELSLDAPDALKRSLDVTAFLSVLHNLLGNALNYVQQGGHVAVQLESHGDGLLLSVADNGPGIAEHERERIFERFYRGNGQEVPGSGLGLSIVKQAAVRLNGSVHLLSGLDGCGCRFLLRIGN